MEVPMISRRWLTPRPFSTRLVLRQYHVVVFVFREMRVHAVAGLARFSVPDVVRHDDVVARDVQQLARAEEHAGKLRREKISSPAARAVQNQHRVGDSAVRIARRRPQRAVVHAQFRQRLAGFKLKIANDEVAFHGRVSLHRRRRGGPGLSGRRLRGRGRNLWRGLLRSLLRARSRRQQRDQTQNHHTDSKLRRFVPRRTVLRIPARCKPHPCAHCSSSWRDTLARVNTPAARQKSLISGSCQGRADRVRVGDEFLCTSRAAAMKRFAASRHYSTGRRRGGQQCGTSRGLQPHATEKL